MSQLYVAILWLPETFQTLRNCLHTYKTSTQMKIHVCTFFAAICKSKNTLTLRILELCFLQKLKVFLLFFGLQWQKGAGPTIHQRSIFASSGANFAGFSTTSMKYKKPNFPRTFFRLRFVFIVAWIPLTDCIPHARPTYQMDSRTRERGWITPRYSK